jgi:hypothetical protein
MTIIGSATVDDGYNGHTCRVTLNYRDGYVLELHEGGSYKGPIPQCTNIDEAIWMLANHPTAKRRYRDVRPHEAISVTGHPMLRERSGGRL